MEEGKRILSLRKKRTVRPKISAPKQISAPIASPAQAAPTLQAPPPRPSFQSQRSTSSVNTTATSRPRADGDTADYVKRRYSTKIPQLPPGFGETPALPSVPAQFLSTPPARAEARGGSVSHGDALAVDLQALHDPELKPDQYVAHLLANATEQDIHNYQQDLVKIKNRTSTDLQHNVYQNRSQFIKISQEADKLKAEMRTLRNLMSDLNSTLGQTNAALGIDMAAATSARKYANRSSVANLEAMWSSHLQELWRRVEGSQKFLPAIPGRHVVYESGRWVELNTATWKPRRKIHLILLNDHLLIAADKKRTDASPALGDNPRNRGPQSHVLAADKCFAVQDIEMDDLASAGPAKKNNSPSHLAVNVRVGLESYTFAATDPDGQEKAALLARFRKANAEMRKSLRVDVKADQAASPNINGGASPNLVAEDAPNGDHVGTAKVNMLVEVDGRQQEFRWLEIQCDELDIDIALQKFEKAVKQVDTLRRVAKTNKSNLVVQDLIDTRVRASSARLSKAIIRQMKDTSSRMSATQQHVAWLIKLGFEPRAAEAFLEARSEVVRSRIGQSSNLGDLQQYIWQLSFVYFTLIKNTIATYQACFAPPMVSACIKWAKDHVDEFNSLLARQMKKLEKGGEDWNLAIQRVQEHEKMLREVNVDFSGLVARDVEAGV